MPKFKIPVSWTVCGVMHIEADTLDDALDIVDSPETPLPDKHDYLEGSFQIDHELLEELNSTEE